MKEEKSGNRPGMVAVDLLNHRQHLDDWCERFSVKPSKVVRRLVVDFLAMITDRSHDYQMSVAKTINSRHHPSDVALILAQLPECAYKTEEGNTEVIPPESGGGQK